LKYLMILIGFSGPILFCLLYFVFFSYEEYGGHAQFLPPLILPLMSIVLFVCGTLFAKRLLNMNTFQSVLYSILLVVILLILSGLAGDRYRYFLKHYYQSTGYTNLLHLQEYGDQKGNYLTLTHELNKEGIKVTSLFTGSNDKRDWRTIEEQKSYVQAIYYANDHLYVLYDWEREEIVKCVTKKQMEALWFEQTTLTAKDIERIVHTPNALYIEQKDEELLYVFYPEEGDIQFDLIE
jgi:hypothetical protein